MNAPHEHSPVYSVRRVGRYRGLAMVALCSAAAAVMSGDTLAQDADHQIRCMQLQQELASAQGGGGREALPGIDRQIQNASRVYNGTKTVAITPDYSEVAKLTDHWLHPKQGTAAALAFAFGHVILKEFHVDKPSAYFTDYCRQYSDMPLLVLEPLQLAFGDVTLGDSSSLSLTVRNDGAASLSLGDIGLDGADFSLGSDTCSQAMLTAGASCIVQVNFAPSLAGARSGNVSVARTGGDDAIVALSGNGIDPTPGDARIFASGFEF